MNGLCNVDLLLQLRPVFNTRERGPTNQNLVLPPFALCRKDSVMCRMHYVHYTCRPQISLLSRGRHSAKRNPVAGGGGVGVSKRQASLPSDQMSSLLPPSVNNLLWQHHLEHNCSIGDCNVWHTVYISLSSYYGLDWITCCCLAWLGQWQPNTTRRQTGSHNDGC